MHKHLRIFAILLITSLFIFSLVGCDKKKDKKPQESEKTLVDVKISYGDSKIKDSQKKYKIGTTLTFNEEHKNNEDYLYLPKAGTITGKIFKGWFLRSTNKEVTEGYKIEGKSEIYARYESMRFELNFDLKDAADIAKLNEMKHNAYYGSGEGSRFKIPEAKSGKEDDLKKRGRFLYYYIINREDKEIPVTEINIDEKAKEVKGKKWEHIDVKNNKIYARWLKDEAVINIKFESEDGHQLIAPPTSDEDKFHKYEILKWEDKYKSVMDGGVEKIVDHWYYKRTDGTKVIYNFKTDAVFGDMLSEDTTLIAHYSSVTKELNSEADYNALVAEIETKLETGSDEDKKNVQNMVIKLKADITLTSSTKALFRNAKYPFLGRLEGEGHSITFNANGKLAGFGYSAEDKKTIYSLIGYNAGHIEKIKIVSANIDVVIPGTERIYVGLIAYENSGKIENCEVSTSATFKLDSSKQVGFGGIAYITKNNTHDDKNGYKVAKSYITNCKVNITVSEIKSNSVSFGGITYNNVGEINKCEASVTVENVIDVQGPTIFGGLAGANTGKIEECKNCETILTVNSASSKLNTDETFIGGLIGKNYSEVKNIKCSTIIKVDNSTGFYAGGIFGLHSGSASHIDFSIDVKKINSTENIRFGIIAYEIFRENTTKYTSAISSVYAHGKVNIKRTKNETTGLRFTYMSAWHSRITSEADSSKAHEFTKASFRKILFDVEVDLESKKTDGNENLDGLEVSINPYEKLKTAHDIGYLTFITKKDGEKFKLFSLNGNNYSVKDEKGSDLKEIKIKDKSIFEIEKTDNIYFREIKDGKKLDNNPLDSSEWDIKSYYGTVANHPSITEPAELAKIGVPSLKVFA